MTTAEENAEDPYWHTTCS